VLLGSADLATLETRGFYIYPEEAEPQPGAGEFHVGLPTDCRCGL